MIHLLLQGLGKTWQDPAHTKWRVLADRLSCPSRLTLKQTNPNISPTAITTNSILCCKFSLCRKHGCTIGALIFVFYPIHRFWWYTGLAAIPEVTSPQWLHNESHCYILLMVQKSGYITSWGIGSLSHYLQGFILSWVLIAGISEPSTVSLYPLICFAVKHTKDTCPCFFFCWDPPLVHVSLPPVAHGPGNPSKELNGAQPPPCCSFAGHLAGKMVIHCSFAHD